MQADGWIGKRQSSHEDALRVVDPLFSDDLVIIVEYLQFTDCYPEAILDVNKRRDFNYNLLHRRQEERLSDYRPLSSSPVQHGTSPHCHSL